MNAIDVSNGLFKKKKEEEEEEEECNRCLLHHITHKHIC
jgi:hypothetical protein